MEECPAGYYADPTVENNDGTTRTQCMPCHEACMQCLENEQDNWAQPGPTTLKPNDPPANELAGYKNCCGNTCKAGYYRKYSGLEKIECLKQCPPNYYGDDDTRRCIEKWTVIAYQDSALLESDFSKPKQNTFNLEDGAQVRGVSEPLQTFFNLDVLSLPQSTTENEAGQEVWKVCKINIKSLK